jgi:DNA sulfur modification protein DndD
MENFRQFYGKQDIDFFAGEKNITLVKGNNGFGKTSIFRALIFGLYGEKNLSQDNQKEDIHLVNFKAIRENEKPLTEAKVRISFESNLKQYFLERTVKANNTREEHISSVELFITDESGNHSAEPIQDDIKIKNIIKGIIGSDIKEFFFFDGEKIETLAKTNSKVKKEIKNAIVKLLHIESIEKAFKLLALLYSKEQKSITKKAKELNLENIQSGTYNVKWYFEWSHSNSKSHFNCRLIHNNNYVSFEMNQNPKGKANRNSKSGFDSIELESGDHLFELQFSS